MEFLKFKDRIQTNDYVVGWTRDEVSQLNVGDIGTINLYGNEFDFEITDIGINVTKISAPLGKAKVFLDGREVTIDNVTGEQYVEICDGTFAVGIEKNQPTEVKSSTTRH